MIGPDTSLPHAHGKPVEPDFIIKAEKPILFFNFKKKWIFKSLLFNLKVRLKNFFIQKKNN